MRASTRLGIEQNETPRVAGTDKKSTTVFDCFQTGADHVLDKDPQSCAKARKVGRLKGLEGTHCQIVLLDFIAKPHIGHRPGGSTGTSHESLSVKSSNMAGSCCCPIRRIAKYHQNPRLGLRDAVSIPHTQSSSS